jgi:hypothetical protein
MKIDKNIPLDISKTNKGARCKYPFYEMKMGDSFFLEAKEDDIARVRNNISIACNSFKKRHKEYNFAIRTVKDGLRVWRIEVKNDKRF